MPPSIGDLRVKSSIRYFEQHVQAFDKHTYFTVYPQGPDPQGVIPAIMEA